MSTPINNRALPFKYTVAGVIPINTILLDWDTREDPATALSLHVTSLGTTGVITPEFSSDDVNYVSGWVEPATINSATQATITAAGLYIVPKLARFIRFRMSTATTAGTTTFAVVPCFTDLRSSSVGSALTSTVNGPAAHDAAVSGNPVRLAGRAVTANYTGVATGDTADLITTVVGAAINKPYSIPEADWQYAAAAAGIVNTTDVVAKAAAAAGIRNYVTAIQLRNTNAVATEFVIKDGATVIWRTQLPASMTGSMEATFPTPLKGTAAAAINIACITTGAAVYANLQGYAAP